MLKNYIKVAIRNIRQHPVYSSINIIGLAIGLASAIVIGRWVHQEWSYDKHFAHSERIYRVGVNFMNVGDMAPGPPQFSEYVREFPEVERAARLDGYSELEIRVGDETFRENRIYYADSAYFDIFSYDFVEGSRATALDNPNQAVLTREVAQKIFRKGSAIGKTLLIGEDETPYVVSGVVGDQYPSHINARIWLSIEPTDNTNWLSGSSYNYVLLKEGISLEMFRNRLRELIKTRVYTSLSINQPFEEWIESSGSYRFIPVSIEDIYLKSNLKFEPNPGGNVNNVYAFAGIALLILVIAAINFINITTARASIRAKEVGIRKTLGTGKLALVSQFLMESVFISFIALILSLGLGELFLNLFEQVTGQELLDGLLVNSEQVAAVTVITLGIGLLAGLYPAFRLTSFSPTTVLKGKIYSGKSERSLLRDGMVFLQFAISVTLLIGTGVIFKQLQYMQTKDLGFNEENVMVISNAGELGNQKGVFKESLLQMSGVETASYNFRIPAGSSVWVTTVKTDEMEDGLPMQSFHGDAEMVETLGFRLLEGRSFSRDLASDTAAVLLNQSAVQALELEEPIGSKINGNYTVIGVVADFNFESLKKKIEPVVLMFKNEGERLALKMAGSPSPIINRAEQLWSEFGVEEPIDYYFLDENFEAMMTKEKILSRAAVLFTLLAIIISCLGLYGLSAYLADQRTREIGIRKVMGATVGNILFLLNKDFTKPVITGIAVSIPAAYIMMNTWLENFAYKTPVPVWIFLGACIGALAIAWLTVSVQSVQAATRNPVDSLRSE